MSRHMLFPFAYRYIHPAPTCCLLLLALAAGASQMVAQQGVEGLEISGAPDLPPEIVQGIAPYWLATSNDFMGWDPASGGMLVSSMAQKNRQLHLLSAPGSEIMMHTSFPAGIISGSFLPKKGGTGDLWRGPRRR